MQPACRLQRREREEKISDSVAPSEHVVDHFAIETVIRTLLSRLERKVSPNKASVRQQSSKKNVGTEVHVMMAIESFRLNSIETTKLVELSLYNVPKGPREPRVEEGLGGGMPQQARSDLMLTF